MWLNSTVTVVNSPRHKAHLYTRTIFVDVLPSTYGQKVQTENFSSSTFSPPPPLNGSVSDKGRKTGLLSEFLPHSFFSHQRVKRKKITLSTLNSTALFSIRFHAVIESCPSDAGSRFWSFPHQSDTSFVWIYASSGGWMSCVWMLCPKNGGSPLWARIS